MSMKHEDFEILDIPNDYVVKKLTTRSKSRTVTLDGMEYGVSTSMRNIIRAGFKCYYCGHGLKHFKIIDTYSKRTLVAIATNDSIFNIDHVIPRSRNGANILENMATSCSSCNHKKKDDMPTVVKKRVLIPTFVISCLQKLYEFHKMCEDLYMCENVKSAMNDMTTLGTKKNGLKSNVRYLEEDSAETLIKELNNKYHLTLDFQNAYVLIPAA